MRTGRICSVAALAVVQALGGGIQPAWVEGRSEAAPTVVLIGGLKGPDGSGPAIEAALRKFEKLPQAQRRFHLYGIAAANPAGEALVFPPAGTAYRQNGQSHFIWRWLGLHAPDLAIVVGEQDFGLAGALGQNAVAGMGRIPAVHATASEDLLRVIPKEIARSEAHAERDRRLAHTPHELAEELAKSYGHDFDPAVYIPAMALIGRLRLGQQAEVARLLEPYVDRRKDSLAKATASHLAGHLIFAAMAEKTGDPRYLERVRAAADLPFTDWSEMSDAVFMGCPILASAGKLTGKSTYFDKAADHLQAMRKLCLRSDGLYRHSPWSEAAWGRGNAFPALGVAWTLGELPESHAAYAGMVREFQAHMATLAKFQDRDGMWHEVIDRPESYAEFSATAMIATAMLRGVSRGWLDASYGDRARAAWRGVQVRVGPEGVLVDVCEGTGKQKSLEDYLNRGASLGRDARGGGMALLLATEMDSRH